MRPLHLAVVLVTLALAGCGDATANESPAEASPPPAHDAAIVIPEAEDDESPQEPSSRSSTPAGSHEASATSCNAGTAKPGRTCTTSASATQINPTIRNSPRTRGHP